MLSGSGLSDGPTTRPEESYRMCGVCPEQILSPPPKGEGLKICAPGPGPGPGAGVHTSSLGLDGGRVAGYTPHP